GIKGFEYEPYLVFCQLAKSSDLFFDIGSNIGYYSFVAKSFNPSIKVFAFEPMPSVRKYLEINCKLNNFHDVKIHEIALSNSNTEATFYSNKNPRFPEIEDHLYGDNSLIEEATGNISKIEVKVKTQTLDIFVERNLNPDQKIDLMKLDTEGSENLVLEGAKNVLKNHRPIIMCEVIKGFIEKEIETILLSNNYKLFAVNENGLTEVNNLIVEKGKLDFFFVPEEKVDKVEIFLSK
ncbi:MAG: FkbM family methyltransferase, partial [Bacteroidia bacterium]